MADGSPLIVVNATLYDGCLEKVCLELGLPCVSQSDKQSNFNTGLSVTKMKLMNLWKEGSGVMKDRLPRYKNEPDAEELPVQISEPELKLCTLIDDCLCLPRETLPSLQSQVFPSIVLKF